MSQLSMAAASHLIPPLSILSPAWAVLSTKARETSNKYISAKVIPFILTIKGSLNITVKSQTLIVACKAQHGLVPANHVFPKVFPSASTLFLPLWTSEMTYLSGLLWTKCLCPPQIHMRPYPLM